MAVNPGAMSAIPVEVFAPYIVEKLRRTNPHLACAFDETTNVIGGSVVHIPQAGDSPGVVKNRSTFPGTVMRRGDSHITYPLDVYSTDPQHVAWHEENENSYDKTDSVLSDIVNTLSEAVGDNMFYAWIHGLKRNASGSYVADILPASNRIRTTGSASAVNSEDGQTGSRKALTYKELQKAQAMMNKAGVPKEGRYACLESYMYQQFLDSLSANQMAAFQSSADLANGIVGKFAGFQIMERSVVLAFKADGTPHQPGAALEATSDLGCLLWQKESVAKAMGTVVPFQEIGSPTYYGDVFSALVKMGGRCRRQDWKGVIAILQAGSNPTITCDGTITTTSAAATVEKAVAISTGDDWAVVNNNTSDDWFIASKSGDSVKIVFSANTASGASERSGSVTISIPGTTVTKSVTVTQSA